jgi:integrase
MIWTDIAGNTIRVAQQKTGTKLVLPLHPDLQALLAIAPRKQATILATELGADLLAQGLRQLRISSNSQRWSAYTLQGSWFAKAAARRLAEAGCTTKEVAAVTGHKSLNEIERYTRAADQERLAQEAVAKLSRGRTGRE